MINMLTGKSGPTDTDTYDGKYTYAFDGQNATTIDGYVTANEPKKQILFLPILDQSELCDYKNNTDYATNAAFYASDSKEASRAMFVQVNSTDFGVGEEVTQSFATTTVRNLVTNYGADIVAYLLVNIATDSSVQGEAINKVTEMVRENGKVIVYDRRLNDNLGKG
jgi:hypothetical protein